MSGERTGLTPTRTVLPNGTTLLVRQTQAVPAVTISLAMRAGSICDPVEAPGAIHLLSKVIDRGTATRSAVDIAEDLDGRGTTLTTTVTRHSLTLSCTCLTEDFHAILDLMGDIVMAPSFAEEELAKRKAEVITAIRQDEDNPAVRATETLMALLYPEPHPYGRPTKGRLEIVDGLTRERLVALHAARFAPNALSVAIVGDLSIDSAASAAEHVFGSWRASQPSPITLPPVVAATTRRRVVIPMMNKAQADIAYGFTAVTRKDPAYYPLWLMNNIMGQYSMGGRLGDSIRERQGMAYYVYSRLDANVAQGPLSIYAGIGPANVDRAVASIDEEVGRLAREGATAKELNESRQYLVGSMPREFETNSGIANFMQMTEFFGLGLDFDVQLPDLLHAVTLDDIHAAARRILDPARATIVIAGPYRDSE